MDDNKIIYHITKREEWKKALEAGIYQGDTLTSEGFIHCSTKEQLINTANRIFHSVNGLVLLCIERIKVKPKVIYENLEGEKIVFPHIYGPLNLNAVIRTLEFKPGLDGTFSFPLSVER
jgi:uncharacterized protein (DUF952 family)